MSNPKVSGTVVTVDEQAFEKADEQAVNDDGFEVVDETPQLEATVDQEEQAKVDANHPDGIADTSTDRIPGVTLAQEERIRAREAELDRMNARAEFGSQAGRERRTREVAADGSRRRRARFKQRAASVNPWAAPERADPRAELSQEQLAAVNRHARRLAEELAGWSRAAIARRLGGAVADGRDVTSAVVRVFETLEMAPGTVIPIGKLADVDRKEVSIDGHVKTLWDHHIQASRKWDSSRTRAGKLGLPSGRNRAHRGSPRANGCAFTGRPGTGTRGASPWPLPAGALSISPSGTAGGTRSQAMDPHFFRCAGPAQAPPPHPPLRARFAARAATTLIFSPHWGARLSPRFSATPHGGCCDLYLCRRPKADK